MITSCNHSSEKLCGSCMQENSRLEYVEYLRTEIAQRDKRITRQKKEIAKYLDRLQKRDERVAELEQALVVVREINCGDASMRGKAISDAIDNALEGCGNKP